MMATEHQRNSMNGESQETSTEGYDNEFIAPTAWLECPICLMSLREPYQTDCGHRFCRTCITKWLKSGEQGRKCPACNNILSNSRVYPDNYAKREILVLRAKCRYTVYGCTQVDILKNILQHQLTCQHRPVPCPNQCGEIVTVSSLDEHIALKCPNRQMQCNMCHHKVPASRFEAHKNMCVLASNSCLSCGEIIKADSGASHKCIKNQSRSTVPCRFHNFGCKQQLLQSEMSSHLEQFQVQHLSGLATAVEKLIEDRDRGESPDIRALEAHLSTLLSNQSESSESETTSNPIKSSQPSMSSATAAAPPAKHADFQKKDEKALLKGGDYYTPADSEVAAELRNQYASQQQHILELRSKVEYLETALQDTRAELRDTKMEMNSRCCGGMYVWRLCNYQKLREEAMLGVTSCVLHSPGFYTNFYGYQFCIRLNLNGVETAQGTHMSLFIHLMQSDNDDILTWPFIGKITLSILDQNVIVSKRKHITETLVAKPGLAAFQKPSSFRNHKGFGYMEFAPISYLESEERQFIKDDTLLIRADIKSTS